MGSGYDAAAGRVVALTFVTVKVGVHPLTPLSLSVTPLSSPVPAAVVIGMFVCAT